MTLEIGTRVPQVTLVDSDRQPVQVPKPGTVTVLVFFPAAFTSVCTTEMCRFRDAMAQFNDLNAQVYGISVDPPFSLAEFKKQNGLTFPLLSDFNHEAIKAYGVEFSDLGGISGYVAARRSVFVIDRNGALAWEWLSEKPSEEPDYDAVQQAVQEAQRK